MSSQSNYWIWDSRRRDYYHAEWNTRNSENAYRCWSLANQPKGAYDFIWSSNTSTASAPRTVATPATFNSTYPATSQGPAAPPVQPLEPFGANIQSLSVSGRGGSQYVYSQPSNPDTNALAHSFGQLSTTGYGSYSQSFAAPPRTSSIPQATRSREHPTVYHDSRPRGYSTSHTPASRPAVSFGSSSAGPPESSRAAGKRVAPDYGSTSAPGNALDHVPTFGREGRPSDAYASGPTGSRYGSSLEAQTSTGSYMNYDATAASTTVSGNRTSHLSVQNPKGRLDPAEFYVRIPPHEFFVEGKVFIKLHTEDAGSNGDHSSFGFSTVAYEELAYSQLRRFVVVKARPKEHYCLCVGKGATKKSIDKNAHAIIYTGSSPPERLPGEQGMNKNPLRVIPVRADEKLDTRSRINLGKTYPVEWNTKVKEIGRLEKSSLVKMIAYWKSLINT
ncbi:MAG: hypothetical protein Q9172_004550 [Xanthocarpia lactea]